MAEYWLAVKGRAWGGFNAEMQYQIGEQAALNMSDALAESRAGDFEYLTEWKVYHKETTVVIEEIAHGSSNPV